jgi:amino acid adenylation domain-containing protein
MHTSTDTQNGSNAAGREPISLDRLRDLWRVALNVPGVQDTDSFLALGGHSMAAIVMLAELQEHHGVELGPEAVFQTPVLRDFFALLQQQHGHAPEPSPAASAHEDALQGDCAPLSFQQLQVWTAYQLSGNPAPYNLPIVYRLTGAIDPAALRTALERLSQRHEILRTTYGSEAGVPRQTVHAVLPIPMEVHDLAALDAAAVSQRLAQELARLHATPIAIEREAPLAVRLLRTGADAWHLLVCIHHIAFDGWSLKVFFEDLSALYEAVLRGAGDAQQEAPRVPYRRYALHSRRTAEAGGYADALDYFSRYLEGLETLNALPTDSPRGPGGPGPAANVVLHVDAARNARLAALAARHETTPFAVYLSALALVVARQTHRQEAVIGVPTANRELADFRSTVGFFANTTPLRLAVPAAADVARLLRLAWDNVQQTFRHARLPFPLLVQALAPARSSSCNPVFQIAFAFQNSAPPAKVLPGVEASYLQAPNRFSKFDLTVNVGFDAGGAAQIDWEYDTALFRQGTMERMARRFDAALAWMEQAGEQPLASLPLLADEAAPLQALAHPPAPRADGDLVDLLRQAAAAHPRRDAVVQGARTLSYAGLEHACDLLAARLQDAGVRAGEPVAYAAARSIESVVTQLAILKAGAAYLPMDVGYPEAQRLHMARDSGAALFLAPAGTQPPDGMRMLAVDAAELAGAPARRPRPVPGDQHAAYLMYTSGTSGQPKGVWVPRSGIVRLARDNGFLALGPDTVMLHAASPSFDAATFEIFGALLNGGSLVCHDRPRLDLQELLPLLRSAGVTTMWLTAGLLPAFADLAREPLPSLRHLLTGGDVVAPDAVARLHLQQPQLQIINGYGPTENTTFTTCHRVERGFDASRPLPIGRPIAATSVRVVGPGGSPCGVDQPGELWTGGEGLALGYHNAPALTAERFVQAHGQRWYRTGDLVRLRADGVLDFLGRIDQEVKIRGYRVDLPMVEARLAAHPALAGAAVIVVGAGAAAKRLAGLYVLREGASLAPGALQAWLAQTLPNYAVPDALQRVHALPTNANGKVDRAALRALHEAAGPTLAAAAELDEDQRAVAALWSELLHTPARWGPEADFFEAGGNSLLVVQLAARLGDAAGRPIGVSTLYNHSSLHAQAGLLRAAPADADPAAARGSGPAVQLRLGDAGPMWIAIPGVGGLAHAFAEIGGALRRQGARLCAFDSLGLRDGIASRGLPGAVRALADAVLRLQAHGPYGLIGHSFGGRVAFELALELERRGEHVTLLMLDAMPGNEVVDIARYEMPGHGPAGLAAWLLQAMGDTAAAGEDPLRRLESLGLFRDLPLETVLGNVEWQLRANRAYRPTGRLLHGTTHLLRAAESDFGKAPAGQVQSALELHCAQCTVRTLAGDHFTMLKRSATEIADAAMDSLAAMTGA